MRYRHRVIETSVAQALDTMPAVFLVGPRQAGKSTLVRHLARSRRKMAYLTFDDMATFAAASSDPEGFLRSFTGPVILDEVQLVPDCFRVLKRLIDERRADGGLDANGRFLLTGSANSLLFPELADALVGRMAVLSLYPYSASEILGQGVPVVNGWFDQVIPVPHARTARMPPAEAIAKATFPEISGRGREKASLWLDAYLDTLLRRDVKQLAEIEKIAALPNIVTALATRAGGLLNDADCARDAGLNPMTYRRYRILLDQLFLTTLVPPWYRNIGKRLVKSPKLYFSDTLLLCHVLGVEASSLQRTNPSLFGRILENFVASELTKQLTLLPGSRLFHFRTHDHKEVDFVVERRDGRMLGIEVKARSRVEPSDFSGLRILKEKTGSDFVRGILLYTGDARLRFGDDLIALPLEDLWDFDMTVTVDGGAPRGRAENHRRRD